jgi:choloylglycine hydrolase
MPEGSYSEHSNYYVNQRNQIKGDELIMQIFNVTLMGVLTVLILFWGAIANACTGIRLFASDKSAVYGRTLEWGAFDLNSRVTIIPRGHEFTGLTPDGNIGKQWKAKYGVVGLDLLGKITIGDGMNEKGLTAGLFYHPGFAKYPEYDPARANITITALDVVHFILTQFATLDEVREGMSKVRVVAVVEESLGIPIDAHFMVTDPQGKSIVIEFIDGEMKIFENPLGIITNSPTYDWHMINLRNYVNLSAVAIPDKKIEDLDFAALGGGSGMIGLPGDFTPPSRFVRATAFSQTARPTQSSDETVYELFRILDSFNVGVGASEGSDLSHGDTGKLRSATLWTTAWDMKNNILYYHTQHNRRVRKIDLAAIDFSAIGDSIIYIPLDQKKEQDVLDITPRK